MTAAIDAFLASQEGAMFDLLEDMVRIQSGSSNKSGVDRMGALVRQALSGLELECRRIAQTEVGDHLVFTTRAAEGQAAILITGHMDTVFPADTNFNWFRRQGERLHGPGVIDMKGGLVVTIFAVRALAHAGLLARIPLILLFNSDEEIGSPTSIPLLEELAGRCFCGLVTECGGLQGEVVTGRRGKRGFRIDVHGQAGHAAFALSDKASAIHQLALLIPALEELNDPDGEIVVNVGRIEGGIGPNSIADHALALVDSRYTTQEDGQALYERIRALIDRPGIPGTRTHLSVTGERPVMEQTPGNRMLYDLYRKVAAGMDIVVGEEYRQGVSDASTLAGTGLPVLDGLGPIGEHDHSDREYMLASSLPCRTRLLAVFLTLLPEQRARLQALCS